MIRQNIILGCVAAFGMDENGIGCIFSTSMDNKQAAATRTTAVILKLCCVTFESHQIRLRLSAEQGGVVRHVGLREVTSSITRHVPLGTCQL